MKRQKILSWKCRDRVLEVGTRPLIMGILNVTPDSFSDGGNFFDRNSAVEHGLQMVRDGADILDVGGESTRPGAAEVSADDEAARVVPVIEALSKQTHAVISVDTWKASIARRAIDAGARIINDVSALTHDADMPRVVMESGAGVVLMHMQGTPRTMQQAPHYDDVVTDVSRYLQTRVQTLEAMGVHRESLAVDPGIGFGKTVEHNLEILNRLYEFKDLGRPICVGTSRKSFIGKILNNESASDRLAGTIATCTAAMIRGADILRVHDVKEAIEAAAITDRIISAGTR